MAKKNRNPNGLLYSLLLIGAMGTAALSYYAGRPPANTVAPTEQRSERLPEHQEKKDRPAVKKDDVTVLKPNVSKEGDITFEKHTEKVPAGEDKYVYSINRFLQEGNLVGPAAKALSAKLNGDTLTIDFSPELLSGYSSTDEGTIVNGITTAAGQFPEVNKVQITVEGQPIDSLGHLELAQPLPIQRP